MLSQKLGLRIFVAHRGSGNLKDVLSEFCALIYRKSLFLCHIFQKIIVQMVFVRCCQY